MKSTKFRASVLNHSTFEFQDVSERAHGSFVYKIPYRRARAWPSGCIGRVRRASKGILHTNGS